MAKAAGGLCDPQQRFALRRVDLAHDAIAPEEAHTRHAATRWAPAAAAIRSMPSLSSASVV